MPWADEAEQQLSRPALSGSQLSADIRILRAGLPKPPSRENIIYVSSFIWQDKQAAPLSVTLCEQCHWQMRLSYSFPRQLFLAANYLQLFAFSEQGCEKNLAGTPPISSLPWKFEVARQASSPTLYAYVRAVPWADEAEQQLSRLAPSGCQLSADVHILRAGQREAAYTAPHSQATFEV